MIINGTEKKAAMVPAGRPVTFGKNSYLKREIYKHRVLNKKYVKIVGIMNNAAGTFSKRTKTSQ